MIYIIYICKMNKHYKNMSVPQQYQLLLTNSARSLKTQRQRHACFFTMCVYCLYIWSYHIYLFLGLTLISKFLCLIVYLILYL